MKKLLLIAALLWSTVASAQFVPGQILTAAELNSAFALYAPLTGANFSGLVSAAGITATPISGSTGSFTNLSASGTVSFPAGTVTPGSLAPQAANTVLANTLGAASSPTAAPIPSCSTSSSGLQWTSGTGFACNTAINASTLGGVAAGSYLTSASASATYAPLASPSLSGTTNVVNLAASGSLSGVAFSNYLASPPVIGGVTPAGASFTSLSSTSGALNGTLGGATRNAANFTTINANSLVTLSTTFGIAGTTLGDAANPGSLGEIISRTTGPTGLVSTTATNVNSITLTPGDWDVSGVCQLAPAASTIPSQMYCGISTISQGLTVTGQYAGNGYTGGTGVNETQVSPTVQINVSSTTTVYLVMEAVFTVSTANYNSFMRARRVR